MLQERFVVHDMRDEASGVWSRFAKSFAFNNTEALIRIPVIALMVESWHFSAVFAAAITLVVAFLLRFVFHSLVVYAPKRAPARNRAASATSSRNSTSPGEL